MRRFGLLLVALSAGCSAGGKPTHTNERLACVELYNASTKRAGAEVKVIDSWVKSERIVIELQSKDGDRVVVDHCIVNPETGQLRLASPYDISWDRPPPAAAH